MNTTSYARRIYIDLGVKNFESSICWILRHYPMKFDRIYGFECGRDLSDVKALRANIEACIRGTNAESIGYVDIDQLANSMSLY